MDTNVVVAIGSNMVGSKQHERLIWNKDHTQIELKDNQFSGASPEPLYEHALNLFFCPLSALLSLTGASPPASSALIKDKIPAFKVEAFSVFTVVVRLVLCD